MPGPTPTTPGGPRLERTRDGDEEPPTVDDVREEQLEVERLIARLISDHPNITMDTTAVLEAVEYDGDRLRAFASDLYPGRFEEDGHV